MGPRTQLFALGLSTCFIMLALSTMKVLRSGSGGEAVRPSFLKPLMFEQLVVDLSTPPLPMSPVMYGAFFEEINHAGEGGLNPELLRDFSFEALAYFTNRYYEGNKTKSGSPDGEAPAPYRRASDLQGLSMDPSSVASADLHDDKAWTSDNLRVEVIQIQPGGPLSGTPTSPSRPAPGGGLAFGASAPGSHGLHAVRVQRQGDAKSGPSMLVNHGHTLQGFAVHAGSRYVVRVRARRQASGSYPLATLDVSLTSGGDGHVVHASRRLSQLETEFTTHRFSLTSLHTDQSARLCLVFVGPGAWDIDSVSLTPGANWEAETYVPYDLTLLKKLTDLRPQFLRFPGGAFLEGVNLSTAYRWKAAVGHPELRPGHPNANWGYWSTDALGLFEFMQLCERLQAQPVWVVNAGISQSESVGPSGLEPWLQDVLDSLEFIHGPVARGWGRVRAEMGRAKPWRLNYLTIGNEDCLRPWYKQHYARIAAAVRKQYPHVTIIANCDLGDDAKFDAWEMHSYRSPADTFALRSAVDAYEGRPVAVTEFAAMSQSEDTANAIAEAGFMAAMERNCHKVRMVAYAPLLAHAGLRTWHPDLVVFDGSGRAFGTPSYRVQQLYRALSGTHCAAVRFVPANEELVRDDGTMTAAAGKVPGGADAASAAGGGDGRQGSPDARESLLWEAAASGQLPRQQLSREDATLEASATCLEGPWLHCSRLAVKLVNYQDAQRHVWVSAWGGRRTAKLSGAEAPAAAAGAGDPKAWAGTGPAGGGGGGGAKGGGWQGKGAKGAGAGHAAAAQQQKVQVFSVSAKGAGPHANSFELPDAVVPNVYEVEPSMAGMVHLALEPFSLTWMVVHVHSR